MQNFKREFFITWRIENFSMCPVPKGDYMDSELYLVNKWHKRKLKLLFFPNGDKDGRYMSCYAEVDGENFSENSTLEYTFLIGKAEASDTVTNRMQWDLMRNKRFGVENLIQREEIFTKRDIFLPNDILTICFRMWIIDEVTETTTFTPLDLFQENENILSAEVIDKFKKLFTSTQISLKSRITVDRKLLVWPIKVKKNLESEHGMCLSVTPTQTTDPPIEIKLFVSDESENQCDRLEIRILENDCSSNIFMKCKLTVLNSMRTLIFATEGEHLFEADDKDVWNFPLSRKHQSELQKIFDSKNEVLFLCCELKLSDSAKWVDLETVDEVLLPFTSYPKINNPTPLSNAFKDLYRTGMLSDVTLRVGERHFNAHKNILCTRSPVFLKMFETDVKKEEPGFVDITDLDPDTLNRLLVYLYSDQLDDLGPESAARLYSAADQYEVPSLKERCSEYFHSMLSVTNVCLVLNLADLHADCALLEVAKGFIFRNSKDVFASDQWKTLIKSNVKLCASVMYQLLTEHTN